MALPRRPASWLCSASPCDFHESWDIRVRSNLGAVEVRIRKYGVVKAHVTQAGFYQVRVRCV